MNDELKKMLSEAFEGKDFASKSDLNEIKTTIESEIKKIGDNSEMEKKINSLNEALNSINEELKKAKAGTTIKKKFVDFGDLGVRAVEEQIKNGTPVGKGILDTKAGEVLTSSAEATTLNLGVEAGVDKLAMPRVLIQNVLQTVPTTLGVIGWTEIKTSSSATGVKAEGSAAGQFTETTIQKSVPMSTLAGYSSYSKEYEQDLPMLATELRQDLSNDLTKKIEDFIINGKQASSIKGLKDYATAFNATTAGKAKSVAKANIFDAIRVAALQAATKDRVVTHVFMHPIDAAELDLQKNDSGTYILPPFFTANGTTIKGMQIVESTSVAAGSMFVVDVTAIKLYSSKSQTVTVYDQHANNAIEGMKTAVAEARFALRVRAHEAAGVIYIADIAAAITAITKTVPAGA